ncbi:hypothetical protein SAMD00023353_0401190 [Rosellinia necatrix]|uniref:Uncharacterized protein n=1 Tax=Rosellinia necatrix TaxID=77044 RepID=A0A1S7UJD1_ROSNE|nr:hypothetical protein SAMD00023353_0401190 [Rosellinia necatrix]
MLQLAIPVLKEHESYDGPEPFLTGAYLIDCLGELGHAEEAETMAINAAAQRITTVKYQYIEAEIKAIGLYWLGRQAFSRKEFTTAQANFERILTMRVSPIARHWDFRKLDCRYFLACIDHEQRRHKSAQVSLTKLSRQQQEVGYLSGAADSRYMLAVSLQSQNTTSDLQVVKGLYRQIIEEKQEGNFQKNLVPRSCHGLGVCLLSEGNYGEAKTYFEKAIDSPLKCFSSVYHKGLALYHLEMYSDAASWFSTASEMEMCAATPRETLDSLYWAGRSYSAMGNWSEARYKLGRAYLSCKEQGGWQLASACRYYFGQALFAGKKYTEAKQHFEQLRETPGNLPGIPLGADYYFGCCLLELQRLSAAEEIFLDSRVLSQSQQARTGTRDSINQLATMSTRFQLLRCSEGQGKLCDSGMLDEVLTFFESRGTARNDENADLALALVEYHLGRIAIFYHRLEQAVVFLKLALEKHAKSKLQSHNRSTLPVLDCQSNLGVTLHELGRHKEAVYPLCEALKGAREPAPAIEGLSGSIPKPKFKHRERLMKAKLDLGKAAHGATHTAVAKQLAEEVLAWTEQELSSTEPEEEQQQQLSEQEQSPLPRTARQQRGFLLSGAGESSYRRVCTQRCALNALVLLAQITYDLGKSYSRAVRYCKKALAVISSLKAKLPSYNLDRDEIRLHAYLALSLAKLPGQWAKAREQARLATGLERVRGMTIAEMMAGRTDKVSYCQAIGGFAEEFGAGADLAEKQDI